MEHWSAFTTENVGDAVWISDSAEGYLEAHITAVAEGREGHAVVTVRLAGGGKSMKIDTALALEPPSRKSKAHVPDAVRRVLPRSDLLATAREGGGDGVENMDELPNLNEAEVLANVQLRFRLDHIYTRTGPVLIAMNPFQYLPIYGDETIRQYHTTHPTSSLPPHCYAEAEDAFQRMMESGSPQAIVICGESGAGKTETTKFILRYISVVAREPPTEEEQAVVAERAAMGEDAGVLTLGDQLVEANPLIEAFGNAKTLRNHNSSRFGKFTIIKFQRQGFISGGRVTEFLLEKSRVSHTPSGERNYHCFYQLVRGANKHQKELFELGAGNVDDWNYLNRSHCTDIADLDDVDEMQQTGQAMQAVGMVYDEQQELWRVIAAVLHVGNVDFSPTDDESSHITDPAAALCAARLLGVDATELSEALVKMVRELPTGLVTSPITADQARASRDALARALYDAVFSWLIQRLNVTFDRDVAEQDLFSMIGILDIFGFENMVENAFEQVFINYTNEQLQHLFNTVMFVQEEEEYTREQIEWDRTTFPSNQPCIDLLAGRGMGIIPFMDSECKRGTAASDTALVGKLHKAHRNHANFAVCGPDTAWRKPDGSFSDRDQFVVKHYAGPVLYTCRGFVDKNRDALFNHVYDVLTDSSSPLIQALFPARDTSSTSSVAGGGHGAGGSGGIMGGGATTGGSKAGQRTVAARFLSDMKDLVDTLNEAEVRFVRCIKSNPKLQPQWVDKPSVLNQLVSAGVIAALKIRRAGFPTRLPYPDFVRQFRVFSAFREDEDELVDALSDREAAGRMLRNPTVSQIVTADEFRFGLTKIFFQADVFGKLENIRNKLILPFVVMIQQWWLRGREAHLQHAFYRQAGRLRKLEDRARLQHVYRNERVRSMLEDAHTAAAYARGLMAFDAEVFAQSVQGFVEKLDVAENVVEDSIEERQQLVRQRAQLLDRLDGGSAQLHVLQEEQRSVAALPHAPAFNAALAKAGKTIDQCRKRFLLASSQDKVAATSAHDSGDGNAMMMAEESNKALGQMGGSAILKRSFTRARLLVSMDDETVSAELDVDEADIRFLEEQVNTALEQVTEAAALFETLSREKERVDQARSMYSSSLSTVEQTLIAARERAEMGNVLSLATVQNAVTQANDAIAYAQEVLDGMEEQLFENVVAQAHTDTENVKAVVDREADFRDQEQARTRGNAEMNTTQKRFRNLGSEAELAGVTRVAMYRAAAAATENALQDAAALEQSNAREYEAAVNSASNRVVQLERLFQEQKRRLQHVEVQREEETRMLKPALDTLSAIRTKLTYSSSSSGTAESVDEATQQAVDEASDAVRLAEQSINRLGLEDEGDEHAAEAQGDDSGGANAQPSTRVLVSEALTATNVAERMVQDFRQRMDAIEREVGRSQKALAGLERRAELAAQQAESGGATVAEIVGNRISEAENSLADASRLLRKSVHSVGDVRDIMRAAEGEVDELEKLVAQVKDDVTESERGRSRVSHRCAELRRALSEVHDLVERAAMNASDNVMLRTLLNAAEASVAHAEGRLSKAINLAWVEHGGLQADTAAVEEAAQKVDEAEAVVLREKRRMETETREMRANYSSLQYIADRFSALESSAQAGGVDMLPEVATALQDAKHSAEQVSSTISGGSGSARSAGGAPLSPAPRRRTSSNFAMSSFDVGAAKSAIAVAISSLDALEACINRARLSREGMEKDRIEAQTVLDSCVTKLQGVVAMVQASGSAVATLCEPLLDAATEQCNAATKMLRRGDEVSTFSTVVQQAKQAVDAADGQAAGARRAVANARRKRAEVEKKMDALMETFQVLSEKAVGAGARQSPEVESAISIADTVLENLKLKLAPGVEAFMVEATVTVAGAPAASLALLGGDSRTEALYAEFDRTVHDAAEKVQEAEECVDGFVAKRAKEARERQSGRIDFEQWVSRHTRCVELAEQWGITDCTAIQSAFVATEKEIELGAPTSLLGHLSRLAVLSARVQAEEEIVKAEKQKKERRLLEVQRVRKELPALQRRLTMLSSSVEAAGPMVAVMVEEDLSASRRAVNRLEQFLDFSDSFANLQPALDTAIETIAAAEEATNRQIQRVRKARSEKQNVFGRLASIEGRFRELIRQVARFCAKSDHLRMHLDAEWGESEWWGSQGKHTSVDGQPSSRGEVGPVPAVRAVADAMTTAENAINAARQRVDVTVEEWLNMGENTIHVTVTEAAEAVEHASQTLNSEMEKFSAQEREHKAVAASLDAQSEKLSAVAAMANVSNITDVPRVSDALREADQALTVVAHVLSAGNVSAAPPALSVAQRAVSDASEIVMSETQRRERLDAEKAAATEDVTSAKHSLEQAAELARLLELLDSPLVAESLAYAEKALKSADTVLAGHFPPAIVSKEAATAVAATEEAERAVNLERARREQLARLKSQREVYARQLAQRKAAAAYQRQEEDLRQRRILQDMLETAVGTLNSKLPDYEEAQGTVIAAGSAVDAAKQKLVNGSVYAAQRAVRSAIDKVEDAVSLSSANGLHLGPEGQAAAGRRRRRHVVQAAEVQRLGRERAERAVVPSDTDDGSNDGCGDVDGAEGDGYFAMRALGLDGYNGVLDANGQPTARGVRGTADQEANAAVTKEYMQRTSSAFEAMTANMHYLSEGLLDVNTAMHRQAQVLALQTNLLAGIGNRDEQLENLQGLQVQRDLAANVTEETQATGSTAPAATYNLPEAVFGNMEAQAGTQQAVELDPGMYTATYSEDAGTYAGAAGASGAENGDGSGNGVLVDYPGAVAEAGAAEPLEPSDDYVDVPLNMEGSDLVAIASAGVGEYKGDEVSSAQPVPEGESAARETQT